MAVICRSFEWKELTTRNVEKMYNIEVLLVYTQSYAGLMLRCLNSDRASRLLHRQYTDAIPSPMQPPNVHFLRPAERIKRLLALTPYIYAQTV